MGDEVLRLDVYEAKEMEGDLMDVELDVSSTAVVSWTVLTCRELGILGTNGELCKVNLDALVRLFGWMDVFDCANAVNSALLALQAVQCRLSPGWRSRERPV